MALIEAKDVYFAYPGTDQSVLRGLSFEIAEGSFVAIRGPSGSGKSTLLYLLGAMNVPNSGIINIAGHQTLKLTSDESAFFRASHIGFIFQQFHLLPKLTLLENVKLGGLFPIENPKNDSLLENRAASLLEQLGLKEQMSKYPNKVSGGQQQRTAIARALMQNPRIILADEPTGNLDSHNSKLVMEELQKLHGQGHTIVLITHEDEVAHYADRIITIRDGKIASDETLKKREKSNFLIASNQNFEEAQSSLKKTSYFLKNSMNQVFENQVRTLLTMIGIVIGVAAVMSMMTLGQFAKEKILSGYAEMGVNSFTFNGSPNWEMQTKDIRSAIFNNFNWEKDLLVLKKIFPQIIRIAPVLQGRNVSVVFGGKSIDSEARVLGINEESFIIAKRKLALGLGINNYQVKNRSSVCVVGFEIVKRLFPTSNPLGQVIFLSEDNQEMPCRIIGVAADLSTRNENRNPNLEVYLPFTYYQAKNKNWWTTQIRQALFEVEEGTSVETMGKTLKGFFQTKYGKTGRFRADSDAVLVEQMNRFLNIFSGFLAAVAFVSLAVGGVGIANMMLVSINERLREIGLKKALGATNKSLRTLILLESVFVCMIAGIFGILLGFLTYEIIIFAATKLMKSISFEWIINPAALLISFGATVAVGILSGLTPAMKAESLSPIQALRSE